MARQAPGAKYVHPPVLCLDALPSNSSNAVKIDIDCVDPAESKRFLPFKPHDQTSNQRLIYEQMVSPENREMFLKTVKEGKDEGWEVILDRLVTLPSQPPPHPTKLPDSPRCCGPPPPPLYIDNHNPTERPAMCQEY